MTERDISELNPHPRNEYLYGENFDVSDLVTSIEENGFDESDAIQIVPNSVDEWPENRIVSGHRRWEAAKQVGMEEVPVRTVEFDDRNEELDYLVQKNKYRQKTDAMLIREGYDYEQRHGDEIDGRTREAVANHINKSGEWYRKGKRVMLAAENGVWGDESLDDESQQKAQTEWGRLRNGNSSVSGAYGIIQRANDSTESDRANSGTESEGEEGHVKERPNSDEPDGEEGQIILPVTLGWIGDIEGKRAEKAREMGKDDLRELITEAIDGYDTQ